MHTTIIRTWPATDLASAFDETLALPKGDIKTSGEDGTRFILEAAGIATQGHVLKVLLARVLRVLEQEREQYNQGIGFEPTTFTFSKRDGRTILRWDGIFTRGRWVEVRIRGDQAQVRWVTGTGEPSKWLGRALEKSGLDRYPVGTQTVTSEGAGRVAARTVH